MLQQGGIYRTPEGQLVRARLDVLSQTRWRLDDVATGRPVYLSRSGPDAPAGALDRLDRSPDSTGYRASPCDLRLDDLALVEEPGPE